MSREQDKAARRRRRRARRRNRGGRAQPDQSLHALRQRWWNSIRDGLRSLLERRSAKWALGVIGSLALSIWISWPWVEVDVADPGWDGGKFDFRYSVKSSLVILDLRDVNASCEQNSGHIVIGELTVREACNLVNWGDENATLSRGEWLTIGCMEHNLQEGAWVRSFDQNIVTTFSTAFWPWPIESVARFKGYSTGPGSLSMERQPVDWDALARCRAQREASAFEGRQSSG